MISLILPYWDRQQAADKALALIAKTYAGMELEIVVVDDGNQVPFVVPDLDLNIRVHRLPLKDKPKSPVTPWNEGVRVASGEIIVLSCIEILHETPVLQEMVDQVRLLGPLGYVLASAWCPDDGTWHCHSTVKVPRNPWGTGIAFCGAMHKSLFNKAGGFDEEYRDGAGYEDNDFINRLLMANATFVIRDDLKVIHPKDGAFIEWGAENFKRNADMYYTKWPDELTMPSLTFVCLNAGNYCGRGAEYVNKLFNMIRRNLSTETAAHFACITDDVAGLDPAIRTIPLPEDINGWWGKLYMFKPGLFPANERIVYFDLDTLIVGPLDEICAYRGDMAILRDFYWPEVGAPGVVLWRSGFGAEIWEQWDAQGRPLNDMGDLGWIEGLDEGRFTKSIDRLQDLSPDRFVSYKASAMMGVPTGASVVCFHGLPRPHDVAGWVAEVWKIDGLTSSELTIINNTSLDEVRANIAASSIRSLKWLEVKGETARPVLIVGGGPSLVEDLTNIKRMQDAGAYIMALNGAGAYLTVHGIKPNCIVVIDSRELNLKYVQDDLADAYFLASQCAPCLFDQLGDKVTLFHIDIPDIGSYVPGERPIQAVGGGVTVGLIAMSLAYTQGFRQIHLFGYDSSYRDDDHHAYTQPQNDGEPVLTAHVGGRTFKAAPWMITQTNQFQSLAFQLMQLGCTIATHGTGLLPTVAWQMAASNASPVPAYSGLTATSLTT